MKVLILSDAQCIHTKRWVSALSERGLDIVLYSIKLPIDDFFEKRGIKSYYFDLFTYKAKGGFLALIKKHYEAVKDLKRVLKIEKPDILHAHYVTSYSFIAALAKYKPFIVSVWGSDIYDFPKESIINKLSVKYILKKADLILSTSHIMAKQVAFYSDKEVLVTPFGVDVERFKRAAEIACQARNDIQDSGIACQARNDMQGSVIADSVPQSQFIIGTVKTLAPKYGINFLIEAFKIVHDNNPSLNMALEIVGGGPDEKKLKDLVNNLNLSDKVTFYGVVDNNRVPEFFNRFSVSVFLSTLNSESFGVSAVEAMACESPVVASDADGFTEVIEEGITGFIVPKFDPESAANAIQRFIDDPSLRAKFGAAGRERVEKLYKWDDNVSLMISIYSQILKEKE